MSGRRKSFAGCVFINCPFDGAYWPTFDAVVFTILACGFTPRCALEELDSGTIRLTRIQRIIRGSRFGIHDLSRVELASRNGLPRFNIPFELGLDIGAKAFGAPSIRQKHCLILDAVPYRYQQFISDIAGQDVWCHRGSPNGAIRIVRNWLRNTSRKSLPGPVTVRQQFAEFSRWLPQTCARNGIERHDLLFIDYVQMARQWLSRSADASPDTSRSLRQR
jgi:hypothetical protein